MNSREKSDHAPHPRTAPKPGAAEKRTGNILPPTTKKRLRLASTGKRSRNASDTARDRFTGFAQDSASGKPSFPHRSRAWLTRGSCVLLREGPGQKRDPGAEPHRLTGEAVSGGGSRDTGKPSSTQRWGRQPIPAGFGNLWCFEGSDLNQSESQTQFKI